MKPLKFNPLLKSTIWGGDKIIPFKHLDITQENVGESWEISGVKGNETTVSEGELEGKSLNEVVELMKDELVGKENYKRFGNDAVLFYPTLQKPTGKRGHPKWYDGRLTLLILISPDVRRLKLTKAV